APLHAGGEAGPAAPAQARVLDHLDDGVRVHAEGLPGGRVVAVPGERERVRSVPVPGENGRELCHSSLPRFCSLASAPGRGASQPFAFASRRPRSDASPADGPSPARPSGKPARIRDASLNVHRRLGPRVGVAPLPARRSSTSRLADSGVWLSKNSQFTTTTGA